MLYYKLHLINLNKILLLNTVDYWCVSCEQNNGLGLQYIMNRKNKEKQNNGRQQNDGFKISQPIIPKFNANWTANLRFDKIYINLADCQYEVLQRVSKQLKLKVKKDANFAEWDVWWTDWHVTPETLIKMEHHQKINHFPGMFNLSRKNLLAKNLMKMRKRAPDQYNFFPLTFNLPLDYNQFKQYFENKPKGKSRTYIVKPESMSQGKGIFLTKRIQEISMDQRVVVQRYISKPYLIDGLKFDLRIYVLVAGVDPLKLFVYHQGLARFATEAYVIPNKDNMDDICMHLTNYAINKQSDKFVFNEDDEDMTIGHKRSLTSIYEHFEEKGIDVEGLKNKINSLIIKTMISGLSHLRFQYRSCQLDNYRGDMCFQILGFDVILSDELEPFLLEINYTPSFSTDTPLDENIKKNLIKDTLILLEITKSFKEKTITERKEFRNNRMLTGKTVRITPEERKQKIRQCQQERNQHISKNLGGYTQIYPLSKEIPEEAEKMEKFEELIRLEDDLLNDANKKKQKQTEKEEKLKEKKHFQKLPILSASKEEQKRTTKIKGSCKLIETKNRKQSFPATDLSLRKQHSLGQNKNEGPAINQLSHKVLKNIRIRDPQTRKRANPRETLVLKPIQFQGGKFDGLCDNYKQNFLRGERQE